METILSERKHKILMCSVDDYISCAAPITSGVVKEKHLSEFSSATLRNELNALEAMGYLKQLHTSSGRVPTSKGYDYFVHYLLKDTPVDTKALEEVREMISKKTTNIAEIVESLASVVSKIAKYPTIVVMNGYDKLEIENVQVIPLIDGEAILLLSTKNGNIHEVLKSNATKSDCESAGDYLTKHYRGQTIGYLIDDLSAKKSKMVSELKGYKLLVDRVIDVLRDLTENGTMNVVRGQTTKLLASSNASFEETKSIFEMLENEDELKKTVGEFEDENEITFSLSEDEKNKGIAVMKAPIFIDGKRVASVGVLGPERMDYALIASALKLVATELDEKNKFIEGGQDVGRKKAKS